jgi:sterol desaturase/sphingolipid hydroxylase (fatty acid hydroxylase superfamily)
MNALAHHLGGAAQPQHQGACCAAPAAATAPGASSTRQTVRRVLGFTALTAALTVAVHVGSGSWPALAWFGLTAAVLVLEAAVLGWQRSSLKALFVDGGWSADLDRFYTAVNLSGAFPWMMIAASLGAAHAWENWVTAWFGAPVQLHMPLLAEVAVAFVIGSVAQYGGHRLMHTRWLWHLHALHHSAERMTLFNTGRGHPLDLAVQSMLYVLPGIFLGYSEAGLTVIPMAAGLVSYWQHSNLPNWLPWVEKWLLAGVANHAVHHARDPRLHGRNLCDFPLVDRLFGTFAWCDERPQVGVADSRPWQHGPAWLEPLRTQGQWLRQLSARARAARAP